MLLASAGLTATVATTGASAATPCAPDTNKCYALVLSPSTVPASAPSTITATATNESPASTTQQLGSMNITAPAGFTVLSVTQPTTGSATVVGNVVQLRNLAIAPKGSASVSIRVTDPAAAGTYTWAALAKQSNNFNGTNNDFFLDPASSSLTTTVSPGPSADLSVTSGGDSPDPVTAGNTVLYTLTAANSGPSTTTLDLADTLAGGTIRQIPAVGSDSGWTCQTSSATQASCTGGSLAPGASKVLKVLVQGPGTAPSSSTSCGAASVIGICNSAAVSGSVPDPSSGNDNAYEGTTVVAPGTCTGSGLTSCGTGFILYDRLSRVTTGSVASAAQFTVGTTTFPATDATGGTLFTMRAPSTPESFCPFNGVPVPCLFQMNLDPVPSPYTSTYPATLTMQCWAGRCLPGNGAGIEIVKAKDDGSTQILGRCGLPLSGSHCWTSSRVDNDPNGNLVITINGITAGDPKYAGLCLPPTNSC